MHTVYLYRKITNSNFDIKIGCRLNASVPQIFSPNGDGKNDIFRPIGSGFSQVEGDYSLEIFDRWGKRIFLTKSPENGWNGKNDNGNGEYVPNGVYVYKVTSIKSTERWEDGEFNTTPFEYIGHITFFK